MEHLIICTPTPRRGAYMPQCLAAIHKLREHLAGRYTVEIREGWRSHYLPNKRNYLLDCVYNKALWVDSDVVPTPADFDRLEAHRLPIVSANVLCKPTPSKAIGGTFIEGFPGCTTPDNWFNYDLTGLIPADWSGMGLVLMDRAVLGKTEEEIENLYPWFNTPPVDTPPDLDPPARHRRMALGEDFAFFVKLLRRGVKMYIDMDCRPQHLERGAEMPEQQEPQGQVIPENFGAIDYKIQELERSKEDLFKIMRAEIQRLQAQIKELEAAAIVTPPEPAAEA